MSGVNRLAAGGLIDRGQPLNFTFDGKPYTGFVGDTLAAALLAANVDVIGRSFKYGRPRGIVGAGAEEPNAIVQLGHGAGTVPNMRATQVALYEGLEARSVNRWPSAAMLTDVVSRLLPPGFYYKTFMAPARLWPAYEWVLRRLAGLGHSPVASDPDVYDKLHHHCDVLVIGAGPAGLAAAQAAAARGDRVLLLDEQEVPGGDLLAHPATINGVRVNTWLAATLAELAAHPAVTVLPRTTAFGLYDHGLIAALERRTDHRGLIADSGVRQRLHHIRARQTILATGALERPLVFSNNDRPGVMLASAVDTYLHRYAVAPGQRLLLFTTNDSAYRTALAWLDAGRELAGVVDVRAAPEGELVAMARARGVIVYPGHGVVDVLGRRRVRGAVIAPVDLPTARIAGPTVQLACDLLAVAGGWSPVVHLSAQRGVKPVWDADLAAFLPGPGLASDDFPIHAVGACAGHYSLAGALASGAALGGEPPAATAWQTDELVAGPAGIAFRMPHPQTHAPKQFVDQQLDVTADAIEIAAREGYRSVEHVKRYTALGFGTDQGKLSNVNGVAILAATLQQSIADTGTTMFRPPYTPVTFGAVAGRDVGQLFDPVRTTAMHAWHEAHGALFENVGQWHRPWYYPRGAETLQQAVDRECLAVRHGVGMLDASTLGKIDIQGKDAAQFLNRMYTNSWLKLAPGKCRYGLMLHDDGMIFDDGVTACLGPDHYLMHTTTGNAAAVLAWLELWRQTEWPELEVYFTSVTDHWSTITVSGPQARAVLGRLTTDIDLDSAAFEFMDWRSGTVAGVAARVFRISFTGELSYEINVSAKRGAQVWEAVYLAGEPDQITPYGTEAMHVLRAEKGFIIVGQDTDGSVTPVDAGMDWAVGYKKKFSFVGRRSLERSDCMRRDRKQLVGLKTLNPLDVLPEGAQLVNDPDAPVPVAMQGHVTSSYYSAALEHSIALALVKGGRERSGATLYCPRPDGSAIAATVVAPVFYDPNGERQRG